MFYQFINRFIIYIIPYLPVSFIRMFSGRYVAGETSRQALKIVRELNNKGYSATLDILGEHSENKVDALDVTQEYTDLYGYILSHNLNCNISIKPTHIGLDIEEECAQNNLNTLAKTAQETNNFLRIDMESSKVTTTTLQLYKECKKKYSEVGTVLQAYLYRSKDDLIMLSKDKSCNVRLCKGIYRESSDIAIQHRKEINYNFLKLLRIAFENNIYVGIATHDLQLIEKAYEMIEELSISSEKFEFQVLYGVPMSGWLQKHINYGYKVRVYVPYGKDWYDYSMRRIKENPDIAGYILKNIFR